MCGEKAPALVGVDRRIGSPPRVRGKGRIFPCRVSAQGITPACAGKRLCVVSRCPGLPDHPRVCGEKVVSFIFFHHYIGSPPRVRGKGLCACGGEGDRGITPACAGKSYARYENWHDIKDHPRVCGEKQLKTK